MSETALVMVRFLRPIGAFTVVVAVFVRVSSCRFGQLGSAILVMMAGAVEVLAVRRGVQSLAGCVPSQRIDLVITGAELVKGELSSDVPYFDLLAGAATNDQDYKPGSTKDDAR